jgi:hypothetical protein
MIYLQEDIYQERKPLKVLAEDSSGHHSEKKQSCIVKHVPHVLRAKHENKKPAGLMQPIPTPDYPWQQVTMDLLLNLPNTSNGHNAAVVFVDRLTKMVKWEPCNITITAEGVAKSTLTPS